MLVLAIEAAHYAKANASTLKSTSPYADRTDRTDAESGFGSGIGMGMGMGNNSSTSSTGSTRRRGGGGGISKPPRHSNNNTNNNSNSDTHSKDMFSIKRSAMSGRGGASDTGSGSMSGSEDMKQEVSIHMLILGE